ncbi:biotin-dependent carboxyltransferase family protein [Winogradskyella sp. UBA3174]|uniref:5-oxoprolinase subunit C family protein n=1 Tax=Winogradskyella sp. UBA3174 TaxID=1947785 RepID=UPI0025F8BB79|nr:biotin-dependent carboxyltransferase family protein [Winogradskyella sp. UBA3174]|tara:strand:+ start:12466 stop:13317 length:852 start_codon:yes stop_codon:yes gene_type:complete
MIKVMKSGFYSSIQDAGRFGYRHYGVPVSGSMDSYSSQFANLIIGNNSEASVMEMTMTGPTLKFSKPTVISISGADICPHLNMMLINMNSPITISANDVLSFGRLNSGFRAYLAIKNGFKTETILGSQSMYCGLTKAHRISVNDTLDYKAFDKISLSHNSNVKYDASVINDTIIEVYKGPEFDKVTDELKEMVFDSNFEISKLNSRMAYQLNPLIKNTLKPILTGPVLPGTVQLTPSGQLIILMRDCQTTGGYPRIFQLTDQSLNKMSQKRTRDKIKISLKDF